MNNKTELESNSVSLCEGFQTTHCVVDSNSKKNNNKTAVIYIKCNRILEKCQTTIFKISVMKIQNTKSSVLDVRVKFKRRAL